MGTARAGAIEMLLRLWIVIVGLVKDAAWLAVTILAVWLELIGFWMG